MSKNYDLIATVDIDIQSPIVDDTSFDNLLIMGPAPKGESSAPDVGVYASLTEVEDAGFVSTGDNADPVGIAARVAFSQSPSPTQVYIAVQKRTPGAIAAAGTVADTNAAVEEYAGKKEGLTGCSVRFDADARTLNIVLNGPVTGVKNTGLFDMLDSLKADGYTVSIGGVELTDGEAFKNLPEFSRIAAMEAGDEDISIEVIVSKENANDVHYALVVSYPDPESDTPVSGVADFPIMMTDEELEEPAVTIDRALGMTGWYVLCTAGVDPSLYEDIAAYIEAQEKMFCYTEMNFFSAGEDGENKPSVGTVYFRTMGVYGRETTDQADEDVPEANWYMNVAMAAKWLNYSSGSETAAFKVLAGVYPSELTSTEMRALADANLNYFITVGNKNITMNGKVVGDEWADIIRYRDWLKNDMQVRVVNLFITRPKVPYTDSGISLVQNQMIASLKAGQDAGGIAEEEFDEDGNSIPGYTTSVALAVSVSASEKASRRLTKCTFKARLAGAIHFAELTGSLTYEL